MKKILTCFSLMLFMAVAMIAFQTAPVSAGEYATCHAVAGVTGSVLQPMHTEAVALASKDRTSASTILPNGDGITAVFISSLPTSGGLPGDYNRPKGGDITPGEGTMLSKSLYASADVFLPLPDH